MDDEPVLTQFQPYEVPTVGEVIAHENGHYILRLADGRVCGYASPSGAPSEEIAAEEIADAIANPPPEVVPVPASVTRRQLFLWLNGLGITRAALRTQLAGNEAALIELEEATEFQRAHPLVTQLGQTLGLSSTQIDDAFRNAATL